MTARHNDIENWFTALRESESGSNSEELALQGALQVCESKEDLCHLLEMAVEFCPSYYCTSRFMFPIFERAKLLPDE